MAPFARNLGHDGPPFPWDEEERRHLRARLDAVQFHLYGLTRQDTAYVLDTFPIVRREDAAAFDRYRTRELTLAYMNAWPRGMWRRGWRPKFSGRAVSCREYRWPHAPCSGM